MPNKVPVNRLVGLPAEIKVEKIISHAHCEEMFISFPKPKDISCPHCGGSHYVVKDSGRERTVRHIPYGNKGSLLTFRHRRYLCKECNRSFYEQVYWLHPCVSITTGLFNCILKDLNSPISIHRIALNNCVTDAIVQSLIDSFPLERPSSLPATLCIDEFFGESGVYDPSRKRWNIEDFHCILANGDSGFVHDILPRMDKASLKKYFMEYSLFERQKVKYVCCDMHGPYIGLAKECFSNATICVYLFHVVRRVADCVNEVRIRLQHKYQNENNDDAYTLLRNSSKLLTTARRNQVRYWSGRFEKTKARLDCALSISDDLKTAYDALQEFHQMTEESKFELKRLYISDWLSTYTSSEVPEVRSAANCVKHHRSCIQNSLKYNKSNSTAEGRNRAIKEIKRNSYGHHSFDNFRKRILLAFGPTQFVKETYTVFGEKQLSS